MVTKKLAPKKGKKKAVRRKKTRKWKVSPWLVAAGLLLLAAGILYPYVRAGRFASTGARIPAGAKEFCVDLSHHNDHIVWDSLKVVVDRGGRTTKDLLHAKGIYPVSTVILKATEGVQTDIGVEHIAHRHIERNPTLSAAALPSNYQ